MTEARANDILKTKYPEGEICRKHSTSAENKYWVMLKPEGKAYYYSGTSYQQVLGKLGFKILYKHNVEAYKKQIEELEAKIEAGGEKGLFLFEGPWHTFTEKEIDDMKSQIAWLKNELENSIID